MADLGERCALCKEKPKWKLGGIPYCDKHYKEAVSRLNPTVATSQPSKGGRVQEIKQTIKQNFKLPASPKSVFVGIIGFIIGILFLQYLLGTVKWGDETVGELISANIYPFIEPIISIGPGLWLLAIIAFVVVIVFLIFRGGISEGFNNIFNIVMSLEAPIWAMIAVLLVYVGFNYFVPGGVTQLQCASTNGWDLTKCNQEQQNPVANAEQGVFESPVRITYSGIKPTGGEIYELPVELQPNTNYKSNAEGVVIELAGKTDKGQLIDFTGNLCTQTSACTINRDNTIRVDFASSEPLPCDSKFINLYSHVYYPMESMRNGYQIRIIRSDDDLKASLASDISKASTIYGPVNFYLGFSPGPQVVIPKSRTGEVTVYIYATNEYRGIASVNNIKLIQELGGDNGLYKLNLISCNPIMPSVSQDKNNLYYVFDRQVEIKPAQSTQFQWNWQSPLDTGSSQATSTAETSQIACKFEIPFSLEGTGSAFKTITFHVGGSYSYSEETPSETIPILKGSCD